MGVVLLGFILRPKGGGFRRAGQKVGAIPNLTGFLSSPGLKVGCGWCLLQLFVVFSETHCPPVE